MNEARAVTCPNAVPNPRKPYKPSKVDKLRFHACK